MEHLNTTNLFAGAFGSIGIYFTTRSLSRLQDTLENRSTVYTEPRSLKTIVMNELCTVSMLTVGLTCFFVSLGALTSINRQ